MAQIILPGGLKMKMLDDALGDMIHARRGETCIHPRTPGKRAASLSCAYLDFCVLFVLYDEVDRATGYTQISHAKIAAKVGCQPRTAERSTARLAARNYVQIEQKQVGNRSNGSAVFGGRGSKNVYRLIFERPSGETVKNVERPSPETVIKDRQARHERPSADDTKDRHAGHNTLSLNLSHKNPFRENEGVSTSSSGCWPSVKEELALRFGEDETNSSFAKLSIAEITDHDVVLIAPTKFLRDYIMDRFGDALTEVWRTQVPTITSVRLIERSEQLTRSVETPNGSKDHGGRHPAKAGGQACR